MTKCKCGRVDFKPNEYRRDGEMQTHSLEVCVYPSQANEQKPQTEWHKNFMRRFTHPGLVALEDAAQWLLDEYLIPAAGGDWMDLMVHWKGVTEADIAVSEELALIAGKEFNTQFDDMELSQECRKIVNAQYKAWKERE